MSEYHFIGIGGVGMSAVAEFALLSGCSVSGSDRQLDTDGETRALAALRHQGASLFPQDGTGICPDTKFVIVSTAIEDGNPDLDAAQSSGAVRLHRSEMLARLIEGGGTRVAITGTCGKSTVTGLTGWLLAGCGRDPSVINGAPLSEWMTDESVGSARKGNGGLVVFEADESDRSTSNYDCDVAVITNAFADHFDLDETNRLFDEFAAKAAETIDLRNSEALSGFKFSGGGFTYLDQPFEVPMQGEHNLKNAAAAVIVCQMLGCSPSEIAGILPRFKGISRRLEYIGEARGVRVYDDYAHNTEKIRAVLQTLGSDCERLVAVWRPHGYGPLRAMMGDLADMFSNTLRSSDKLVLLPVYDAGGTADRSVNSGSLSEKIKSPAQIVLAETAESAVKAAAQGVEGSAAIVTLGARDPGLPKMAAGILGALKD